MLEQLRNNTIYLMNVQMGYRRLKEKVKEYNRRDAKLYGNMISKLSKLNSREGSVIF
jgi:FK506-binding protein 4/5